MSRRTIYRITFPHTCVIFLGLAMLVAACDSGGSNGKEGNGPDTTPPPVPSGLSATSGDSEIELSWSAVSSSDLDGYHLYRATSAINSVEGMTPVNGSTPITETQFTDGSVDNGTTYHYRLTAIDTNGNESEASSEVEVTPFPTPPDRP